MDAIHYDKIADKLVNFHSRLPNVGDLEDETAKKHVTELKNLIYLLLGTIDSHASLDDQGWIR